MDKELYVLFFIGHGIIRLNEGGFIMGKISEIEKRVRTLSKQASSVKHSKKLAWIVTRAEINALNERLSPKMEHNKMVRKASWNEGSTEIVGVKTLIKK